MELAYNAGRLGGTMPAVLNAANEEAVALFLQEKIHFLNIPKVIEKTCEKHKQDLKADPQLDDVIEVDTWARQEVKFLVEKGTHEITMSTIGE